MSDEQEKNIPTPLPSPQAPEQHRRRRRPRRRNNNGGEENSEPRAAERPQLPPPPPPPPTSPRPLPPSSGPSSFLAVLLVLGMLGMIVLNFVRSRTEYEKLDNEGVFREMVTSNLVSECEIVCEPSGKYYIRGESEGKGFSLNILPDSTELRKFLADNGIYPSVHYRSHVWAEIAVQVIPIVVILGILYFLFSRQMRSTGSSAMSFGKSRARRLNSEKPKKTFADLAGIEEAKEEVQEVIEFLKSPQRFAKLGGRIPKGILLAGPPGTGKTLLAKAIAGEAGVPFFSISGSDFMEMFVGVGASRVRDMFEEGKRNAPCLIFIDEIDAVGRSRFTGIGGGHDEREQTLNALLVEMDGFEANEGVIVIAATNRPDVLDPALLRPGRFDRQIVIDLPSLEGRLDIMRIHSRKLKLSKNADLRRIARGTPGFSGADLANLMNEAALLAAKAGKQAIEHADLEEARDKVCWGRERRSRNLDAEDKKLTAVHEAGHAVVMALVPGGEPIHKVSIIPRGMALGATMFLPKKERNQFTRTQMLAQLAASMGGRVAEEIFLADVSSGASQDLRQATELARRMVCDWGMSRELGPRTFGIRQDMTFLGRDISHDRDYSEETAQKIDAEVSALLNSAHYTAQRLISGNEENFQKLVELLLERETVDGADAEDIIKFGRVRSKAERRAADKSEENA